MNEVDREIRTLDGHIQAVYGSRTVEGYAVVFNRRSKELWDFGNGTFVEIIERSAITPELIAMSDVKALLYHNRERILGRCKEGGGSLTLELDERGLKYRFTAPNTSDGDTALELVRRGDITGSSFAFSVAKGGARLEQLEDGTVLRTITQIAGLYDITLTPDPAYSDTSVAVREIRARQQPVEPTSVVGPTRGPFHDLEERYNRLINLFNDKQQYE